MGENIQVKSVEEYIKKIKNFNIPKPNAISKQIKLFRGCSSFEYDYVPRVARKLEGLSNSASIFERKMHGSARLKMPEIFVNDNYPIQTLIKLQHYGLPTRMLDFTTNSLVALYFACQSNIETKNKRKIEKDGKVLVYKENEDNIFNCFSPFVNAIADMSMFSEFTSSDFRLYIEELKMKTYWKFSNIESQSIEDIRERLMYPIFFEPELNCERIKRQQGLFLIFPNVIESDDEIKKESEKKKEIRIKEALNKWVPIEPKEVFISGKYKKRILNELVELGITESFLFPEPEHICNDIFNDIKNRI